MTGLHCKLISSAGVFPLRVITNRKYGPPEVLKLEEWEIPKPKEDQILIRIVNTSVNSADWRLRKPDPKIVRLFFGIFKPRSVVLGISFSGIVEAVGKKVTKFQVGDKVLGSPGMKMGTYAEYICVSEKSTITKFTSGISFAEGATLSFGGLTAVDFLQKCNVHTKQTILIYGASSAVGTATIQIAKHFGAIVTTVCSKENIPLLKSLGADESFDYDQFFSLPENNKYDIVFECVGKTTIDKNLKHLKEGGNLVLVGATFRQMWESFCLSLFKRKKIHFGPIKETLENLNFLVSLTNLGKYKTYIDRHYPLEEMVEAHHYVEAGHKKGNVVIDVTKG
ncbi:NAD(P)-dependent alcohol dehydrogenase [Leptospira levettii]|uniref:NAD(P)-dependent alcohol dehydrogenase n=1 Tax=Leptospira levettii TaxID=2023178 RepID=UPI000C2A49BF|nr:NAD(P)-dependent alcohol dehydrogenase [Leptospira levettii]PJZ89871.1 NAD(P)-dependent alcohol dehydrogenase [Leptospira levettii]PJZ99247.1 NAD(P)-dependent alcohol dehydrogenase [Leptospira levettii]